MFFPDDAVRAAALSEYLGRWVAAEAYARPCLLFPICPQRTERVDATDTLVSTDTLVQFLRLLGCAVLELCPHQGKMHRRIFR